MDEPWKGEPITPFMDVYKAKIQSDGSLDKFKLRIVVSQDFQNKKMIGETWAPSSLMVTLNCFLVDAANNKSRLHQLNFIVEFLQSNDTQIFFLNLDSIYIEYFPEYTNCFGTPLMLKKSMYGMNKYGNIFADKLTN